MLNYYINGNVIYRNTDDFWTGTSLAATLQAPLLTMIMSILFWAVVYIKKISLKIIYIIGFGLSFLYLTVIAARTPLIIVAIVSFIEFCLYNIFNKKTKSLMKICAILLSTLIVISIGYSNNMFNIKVIVEESNIAKRFFSNETTQSDYSRIRKQILGMKDIIESPFGLKNEQFTEYSHNMWIDVGREVGIIPFTVLIIYTASTISSLLYLMKSKEIATKYTIFLSSIYIAVNLNFLVEPILQGIPFHFVVFVIINGIIDSQCEALVKYKKDCKRKGENIKYEYTMDS